jgi:hypothetical protein
MGQEFLEDTPAGCLKGGVRWRGGEEGKKVSEWEDGFSTESAQEMQKAGGGFCSAIYSFHWWE